MRYIIIKRWADYNGSRWLCLGWFFYHFLMVCLVVINLAFFVYNFTSLEFTPTETTSLILTFVGFLFAFAGINIYSIFNTNVESEKRMLYDLKDEYEKKMTEATRAMEFSKALVRVHILGRLMVEPKNANSQFLDNLDKASRLLIKAKEYLIETEAILPSQEHRVKQEELRDISLGIKVQIEERIMYNNTYFITYEYNLKNEAKTELKKFIALLESFIDGSAFLTEEKKLSLYIPENPSISKRMINAVVAFIRIFVPQYHIK